MIIYVNFLFKKLKYTNIYHFFEFFLTNKYITIPNAKIAKTASILKIIRLENLILSILVINPSDIPISY